MADPRDLFAIDKVIETAECSIEPVIASEASIIKKIDEYYKVFVSQNEKSILTFLLYAIYYLKKKNNVKNKFPGIA